MDSESTRLLQDLRAALLKAMSESSEMRETLDRLRDVGWSAYVVIDESPEEVTDEQGTELAEPYAAAEPELSGTDHRFLRQLGIDPGRERRGA